MDILRSWSLLYEYRNKTRKQIPDFWKIKIIKNELEGILKVVKDEDKILEIGASKRHLERALRKQRPNIIYKSLDIDKRLPQDYYSLNDIKEQFDVVIMIEVIEHLILEEGIKLLKKIREFLKENGKLVLTTPNIYHPTRYFFDASHKVPYCYDEIGGILLFLGFKNIRVYRLFNDDFFRRLFRLYIGKYLHKFLDVDFALSILITANR